MERYSEYKDSGVKWLGEIPSHWEVMPLKSFIKFEKGKTPKEFSDENIGLPYLTMDYLRSRDNKIVKYPTTSIGLFKIEESEALVLWDGANAGEFILSKKGYLGSTMAKISGYKEYFNNLYFYYFLKMLEPTSKDFANGTTIPHFDASILINYHYPIPPIDEQIVIGSYLDAATSKIDKAIAMQQKMIDLLNERKQIIIQNAVTKGLDENVEMKDSGVEWIGMIPKHWEILKLKRCASIKTGTTPPTNERKYFDGGRISWFTPGDLNDLHLKFASKTITQKAIDDKVGRLFPAKTIYFVGIGATVAKVSACDFAASSNQQINAIICNESLDYIFATYVLKSEQEFIRNMANYVTLPIINQSDTGLIDMIVPPKSEQQAIVAYLGKEMQRFDSAISNCQRQITLLQERKQIIINEVVTGKVKVS